jgi:hypothetical protein
VKAPLTAIALAAALLAGCSSGSSDDQSGAATTAASESPEPSPTTVPAARPSTFDDLNQDGVPDPTCGTGDFRAGLVLRLPCEAGYYASDPSEGTTFVPGSLAALPGLPDDVKAELLTDVSANAIGGRDESGKLVVVIFIQSDTLFATGAASLSGPARTPSTAWPATSTASGPRPPSRSAATPTRPGACR